MAKRSFRWRTLKFILETVTVIILDTMQDRLNA